MCFLLYNHAEKRFTPKVAGQRLFNWKILQELDNTLGGFENRDLREFKCPTVSYVLLMKRGTGAPHAPIAPTHPPVLVKAESMASTPSSRAREEAAAGSAREVSIGSLAEMRALRPQFGGSLVNRASGVVYQESLECRYEEELFARKQRFADEHKQAMDKFLKHVDEFIKKSNAEYRPSQLQLNVRFDPHLWEADHCGAALSEREQRDLWERHRVHQNEVGKE